MLAEVFPNGPSVCHGSAAPFSYSMRLFDLSGGYITACLAAIRCSSSIVGLGRKYRVVRRFRIVEYVGVGGPDYAPAPAVVPEQVGAAARGPW
jgi:hypothetical protein